MSNTLQTVATDAEASAVAGVEAAAGSFAHGGGLIGAAVAGAEAAAATSLPDAVSGLQAALAALESRVQKVEAAHPLLARLGGVLAKFFPHEMSAL